MAAMQNKPSVIFCRGFLLNPAISPIINCYGPHSKTVSNLTSVIEFAMLSMRLHCNGVAVERFEMSHVTSSVAVIHFCLSVCYISYSIS